MWKIIGGMAAGLTALTLGGALWAQHNAGGSHGGHGTIPTEPGDAGFAAITEIVEILREDPATDWSRVDIDGLREHLVDMHTLVEGAVVVASATEQGLLMQVSTTGRAGEAASRMVPAHGPVMAGETGWRSSVTLEGEEILWHVEDPTGAEVAQIQALGFFGLMATGDHHRPHHMALARGVPLH
ncbi:MAG: hypothetical protein AAFQ33_03830 [Pseudomonadota bacterium]